MSGNEDVLGHWERQAGTEVDGSEEVGRQVTVERRWAIEFIFVCLRQVERFKMALCELVLNPLPPVCAKESVMECGVSGRLG